VATARSASALNNGDLGLGSAIGWTVALVIFGLSLVQVKVSRIAEE
jgi:hypothetical protein